MPLVCSMANISLHQWPENSQEKKKGRKNNEIGKERSMHVRFCGFVAESCSVPSTTPPLPFFFVAKFSFSKSYADDRPAPSSGSWTLLKPDPGVYQSWLWPTSNAGPCSMVSMKTVLLPGIIEVHPTTGPMGCSMYVCIAGRLAEPYSCPRLGFVFIFCR